MSARTALRLATLLGVGSLVGIAVLAAQASATSDHVSAARTQSVSAALDSPFPPWEYTKGGKLTGFDIDIAHAIGRAVGLTFVFHQQSFDGIIPGIQAGKYVLSISDITDNPAREKVVSFVDYAVQKGGAILIAANNPDHLKGPITWCGKTFALQAGTIATRDINGVDKICTTHGKPKIITKIYQSNASTLLAVKSGAAVGNFNDAPSLAYVAKTTDNGHAFKVIYYTASWNKAPSLDGIAVAKSQTQLIQKLKTGLNDIIKNGEYGKIAKKYGFTAFEVKSAQVNGAG